MSKFSIAIKALNELGPQKLGLFALYRLGLRAGVYRQRDRADLARHQYPIKSILPPLPDRATLLSVMGDNADQVLLEADEILDGRVRSFGRKDEPLSLIPTPPLLHWSLYETGKAHSGFEDIKWLWEPARFGWAFTLGRAYWISHDERYPELFWQYLDTFLSHNPAYKGPNWISAQEAALRVLAFVFAWQVLQDAQCSTPERQALLARAIVEHAARIPSTLIYARAQNNNHLLSEAAGLYTAGLALPGHPSSRQWQRLGWRWFMQGIQDQIDSDGCYIQHSANYQRLMLQLALWMLALVSAQNQELPEPVRDKVGAATSWLLALTEASSGRLPNLGPNDGSLLLPLSACPFSDYRPTLQAAGEAFLGRRPFESGAWDELGLWLGIKARQPEPGKIAGGGPIVLRSSPDCWGYLRAARYHDRPGHADQLHLDLWWRGVNIAQDPGTYRYNAPPPWDNALATAAVHNTLTLQGSDQMLRAGRFLYLDWAQAEVLDLVENEQGWLQKATIQHDGYRRFGALHRRTVSVSRDGWWHVEDEVLPQKSSHASFIIRLHWLLPDWPWKMENNKLYLESPYGMVRLEVGVQSGIKLGEVAYQIFRAGECLFGSVPSQPTWGWSSPTYGEKLPVLSFGAIVEGELPLKLASTWRFPDRKTKPRAAAILVENGQVAMIERRRLGQLYYVFPGGGVETGETTIQAVVRETFEELGLHVSVIRQVAVSNYQGRIHHYFLVERTGGEFGRGTGKELSRSADSERGSVKPIWLPVSDLATIEVYPRRIAELILQAFASGWSDQIVSFEEP